MYVCFFFIPPTKPLVDFMVCRLCILHSLSFFKKYYKMEIPKQLQGLRFNRVRFKDKKAFELGWQKNPYTYSQISQYFPKENYGLICGSDIRALDDDTPNEELKKLYHDNFEETMEVRGHIYFKFDNGYADKIIFFHPTNEYPNSKGKMSKHMGELQGEGTYVVGAYSTHPSGEIYELKKDLPIATISYDKFIEVFGDLIKKKVIHENVITNHKTISWQGDNITNIPISNIISFNGLVDVGGGCFQGEHPKHSSENGMNFRVNTMDNTWFCYRCWTGGGASELIAVMEGIIDCSDVGKNCYSTEQAREVINVAREKYGLATPSPLELFGEVKGLVQDISIIKLAKKYDIEKCPTCLVPFSFDDAYGLFYCKKCYSGGGLKKFAKLIAKQRNVSDFDKLKVEYESEGLL